MFLRKGSTDATKRDLVKSSLNSNNENSANSAIAFSTVMKSLLTLILSKADGFANKVLSPKSIIPRPGKSTTGLMPFLYSLSLSVLPGLWAIDEGEPNCQLLNPAGEKKNTLSNFVLTTNPAMSPFNGTYLNVSLCSSY